MINPDVSSSKDGDTITVRYGPPSGVMWGVPYVSIPRLLAVMDVDAMDDDVGCVMDGDAWTPCNVNTRSPAINGFERIHDEFVLELDDHVSLKNDPERLVLDHGMSERSRLWIHRVIVSGIRNDVNPTISSSNGVLTEPNSTVS